MRVRLALLVVVVTGGLVWLWQSGIGGTPSPIDPRDDGFSARQVNEPPESSEPLIGQTNLGAGPHAAELLRTSAVEAKPADAPGGAAQIPPTEIDLIVTDTRGRPVRDFSADVWEGRMSEDEDGSKSWRGLHIASSTKEQDGDGRCRVTIGAFDSKVLIDAKGFERASLGPFDPDRVPDPLRATLVPLPRIAGVVRCNGRPCDRAWVSVHRGFPETESWTICGMPIRSYAKMLRQVDTDKSGRFEARTFDKPIVYVRAESPGFAPRDLGPFDLSVASEVPDLEFDLDRGGSIEGRVLDDRGKPVPDVKVSATRGDGFIRRSRSTADGSYRLERLTPGPWFVRLGNAELYESALLPPGDNSIRQLPRREEIRWSCEVLTERATHLDLTVPDIVRVTIVVDCAGAPSRISLCKYGDDPFEGTAREADPDGAHRMLGSEPGTYSITLHFNGPNTCALRTVRHLVMGENVIRARFATGALDVRMPTPGTFWMSAQVGNGFEGLAGSYSGSVSFPALPVGRWYAKKRNPSQAIDVDGGTAEVVAGESAKLEIP